MTRFFVGLDLGQANDYSALCIIEKISRPGTESVYHLRYLWRIRGMSYPDIVTEVVKLMQSAELEGCATLVVDATGCGLPVVDLFEKVGLEPIAVSIHGGDRVSNEGNRYRTPKRDLVAILQVLLQSQRLKVATKLELGPVLQQEMLNFKVKIDPVTAHDSYSAWRESDHDDLVLSVALAVWYGEHVYTPVPIISSPLGETIEPSWQIMGYDDVDFDDEADTYYC